MNEIERIKIENKKLKTRNDELQTTLLDSHQIISALKAKVRELETTKTEIQAKINKLRVENAQLLKRLSDLPADVRTQAGVGLLAVGDLARGEVRKREIDVAPNVVARNNHMDITPNIVIIPCSNRTTMARNGEALQRERREDDSIEDEEELSNPLLRAMEDTGDVRGSSSTAGNYPTDEARGNSSTARNYPTDETRGSSSTAGNYPTDEITVLAGDSSTETLIPDTPSPGLVSIFRLADISSE